MSKAGERFDAVVVGSGFGGSVMTYRLAEAGHRVCLLERGRAYPPGSFPRSPSATARNFWNPSEGGYGLYQVWGFPGIESVVSAGLGGGSLIYANVLIRKDGSWFVHDGSGQPGQEDWPVTRAELDPHYDRVEEMLSPQTYPFDRAPYASTAKTVAFQRAAQEAGYNWFLPNLAVTFANPGQEPIPGEPIVDAEGVTTNNIHQRTRYTCRLVGECDIGCNYGSKNSLDYTYLSAAKRAGATIRTLCEVRSFMPRSEGGYLVDYVEHSRDREGQRFDTSTLPVMRIEADRVVLSAGTFGTTYLLLRNRANLQLESARLGTRFSSNGDLLGFAERRARRQLVSADDGFDPSFGPVITSSIRVPDALDGGQGRGFYIQEGGFPALLGWVIEAADTPASLWRGLHFVYRQLKSALRHDVQSDLGGELEMVLGDAHLSSNLMIMLGMGRDTPDGVMSLAGKWLQLKWDRGTSQAYFDRVRAAMKTLSYGLGADFRVNPLWYFNKLITVHGLGGCPMGRTPAEGVVDPWGEVFGCPGLYVADGSVMPGPVGPNPSLTIAALADRFADGILRN